MANNTTEVVFQSESEDGLDLDNYSDQTENKDSESFESDSEPEPPATPSKTQTSVTETTEKTEKNEQWKKDKSNFSGEHFLAAGLSAKQQSLSELTTPYQFFRYFFTDELVAKIAEETNIYSNHKNPNKPVTSTGYDVYRFIGICVLTSLAPPNCVRDLWNDVYGITLVKETMTMRYFEKLHGTLHFNDNSKSLEPDNKLYKIKPILNYLNHRCLSVPMSEYLSIDEDLANRTFNANRWKQSLKTDNKDRPVKRGYKLFVLCGDQGFVHKLEVVIGQDEAKARTEDEPDVSANGNIVVRLSRDIPKHQNHKLSFDSYFSSLSLSVHLFQQGIQCIEKVQRKIPSCKFKNEETRKESPEEFPTNLDQSNNTQVGTVETLETNMGRHQIKVRSKRWYVRLFFHLVDIIVINSWILFRKTVKQGDGTENTMTQKEFRTILAETLCRVGPGKKRRKPSNVDIIENKRVQQKGSSLPTKDVRLDPFNHWPAWNEKRKTCKHPHCKGYTYVMCEKCKVNLCLNKNKNCFRSFHNC